MSKDINILKEIGNKNPFKVPEGYFEGLSDRIMSQLPDRMDESPKRVSLWARVQPWVYMAAMFCGIALMINFFNRSPQQSVLDLLSSADIEDFSQYYEEQLASSIYNDAFYMDDIE